MTAREAYEVVAMLDNVVGDLLIAEILTSEGRTWRDWLLPMDAERAAKAVAQVATADTHDMDTFLAAYDSVPAGTSSAEGLDDHGLPFVRPLDPWVKGWIVARSEGDERVLAEQRAGYDDLQAQEENWAYRTYVWPDQEQLPADQQAAYVKRGEPLTAADFDRLLTRRLP